MGGRKSRANGSGLPQGGIRRKVARKTEQTQKGLMIRLTTQVEDRELVAAIHALGRDRVSASCLMLLYKDDQLLLEMRRLVLEELERHASSNPQR
jgi:hypothetical protein